MVFCLMGGACCVAQPQDEEPGPAERLAASLHDAKYIKLWNIRREIDRKDSSSSVCRNFRMSAAQVRSFMRRAKRISYLEYDLGSDYGWAPCVVSGLGKTDRFAFTWEIAATGVGKVYERPSTPGGGGIGVLVCDNGTEFEPDPSCRPKAKK